MKIDKISSSLILITIVLLIIPGIARAADNSPIVTYFASEGKIVIRNESKWIRIDPVSDHFAGDQFTITGTTNLPVGAMIIGELYTLPPPCHAKNCDISYEKYGIHMEMPVEAGSYSNSNIFSIPFNTSNIVPDSYTLHIGADGVGDYYSSIFLYPVGSRETILSLHSLPPTTIPTPDRCWIMIDPISDHYVSDTVTITGITNIPESEKIIVEVLPSTFRPGYAPSVGGYAIIKTGANNNTWTFPINTSRFSPEEYSVKVSSYSFNVTGVSGYFNLLKSQSPTTIIQKTFPSTPLSVIGTCAALIGSGMLFMLVWRRVKQG